MSGDQGHLDGVDADMMWGELEKQRERIAILEQLLSPDGDNKPWPWEELNDYQRRQEYTQLTMFVAWIHHTYIDEWKSLTIKDCWYKHAAVRELLRALLRSKQYLDKAGTAANADAAVEWHQYRLFPVLERIAGAAWLKSCSHDDHNDTTPLAEPKISDELRALMGQPETDGENNDA